VVFMNTTFERCFQKTAIAPPQALTIYSSAGFAGRHEEKHPPSLPIEPCCLPDTTSAAEVEMREFTNLSFSVGKCRD
jgi:hypothetical protein